MPPPGEEARRSRWIMRGIVWSGLASVLALVLIFFVTVPVSSPKRGARGEARARISDIGALLGKFDHDYGSFPDASTIAAYKTKTGTTITLDDSSSNKLFRQLLGYGMKEERSFWVRSRANPRRPDDDFTTDATALEPGECSFAYIPGHSSKSDPATPIVMSPLIKGTRTFDRDPYDKRAIILFADGTERLLPIDGKGRVNIGGMDIFDPRQPFWKGKTPDIRWQE